MPQTKRKHDLVDPLKSDSDDEDYDDHIIRTGKSKPSRSRRRKAAKRKRTNDDSEEIESEDDLDEESFEDEIEEDERVEIDERTGRPKRSTTKKPVTYEESDSPPEVEDEDEDEEDDEPKSRRPIKSQVITLKVKTPNSSSGPNARSTRLTSVPRGRQSVSVEPLSSGTRRSGRLHHDDQDPIIALTASGRHAEVIRMATHSPEAGPIRRTRGSKGVKMPAGRPAAYDDAADEPSDEQEAGDAGAETKADEDMDDPDVGTVQPDTKRAASRDEGEGPELPAGDLEVEPEDAGAVEPDEDENEDEDEGPVSRGRRTAQAARSTERKSARSSGRSRKGGAHEPSSDYEFRPGDDGEEDVSSSDASSSSPRKAAATGDDEDDSSGGHRAGRMRKGKTHTSSAGQGRRGSASDQIDEERTEELLEELEELQSHRPRRARRAEIIFNDVPKLRNRKKNVDYRIMRPDLLPSEEVEPVQAPTPSRRGRAGAGSWQRSLFSTQGPFGGAGGLPPIFGGPGGIGAAAGADSDSSDDERGPRAGGFGGVGMTPTSAAAPGLLPPVPAHNAEMQGAGGTPANLGKIKDRKALADADPLGVDANVSFDSVGGLKDHINQLKEMVSLPLLYPEIFQRFHVTPPRGVLFHGPPGTGKTLLARALAASVSSHGRKITFYMRKGADALSKWVGEAERQLRLLFDEARANQPSIIFFDEIDGLAPVRSSKQEQIHASIVSTLLALMDGMDGRGQVIVIGATNRPDNIDPALRRPGRFDREFYFPLPGAEERRAILDIHTKGWEPGLSGDFKDQLADLTKGYGGADLRALCTEAALNAVQRRYPQIYTSNEKLKIDPSTITITAKDFMISVNKIVPSSQRSTSSGAAPLPKQMEALLQVPLKRIQDRLTEILPRKKKLTALEEAQFEDFEDADGGFQRERLQQDFETSRIFRPRLLIRGTMGMGQHHLAAALLNHFEGLHVQSFDLPTLLSDSTRSPEAAVVQLFAEVRRHKPSVIYIPSVDTWYRTIGPTVISTFLGLLRTLSPTDPVLLLGILESEPEYVDKAMLKSLFGFSKHNQFELEGPDRASRHRYFENIASYLRKPPTEFPDPEHRKKRVIETLEIAPPPPPPKPPTKEELKAQKKRDRQLLNLLKIRIQPVMDQIKLKYKKFRTGVIEEEQIRYLFEEQDPNRATSDLVPPSLFRPFEKAQDKDGVDGLVEVESQKFYYNLNIVAIEERLSNGYYKRPKDFTADIRCLAKDARVSGDRDRTIKANEMLANVEVDMTALESEPYLADCENVYLREVQRAKDKVEKYARQQALEIATDPVVGGSSASLETPVLAIAAPVSGSEQLSTGPIVLGEAVPPVSTTTLPLTPSRPSLPSSLSNGVSTGPAHTDDSVQVHAPQSNGSSVPSRPEGDVTMADADAAPARTAPDPTAPGVSARSNPSAGTTQRSIITAMPAGSQAEDFLNDASTTTSGKKTTSESHRSSDPGNTQSTNGIKAAGTKEVPDYSGVVAKANGDSQLPDTQGTHLAAEDDDGHDGTPLTDTEVPSSQGSGQPGSQPLAIFQVGSQPPVPAFDAPSRPAPASTIQALLNSPATETRHPEWILDETYIGSLHDEFTNRTSGCSIEQLEQINTALMDSIWKQRGEWNRTKAGTEVMNVFNAIMQDIEEMQEVLPASLATQ
ncbi:MAG: hypothetical protein M1838_000100 [Thelocarpon superellum]|nr:MAG: hypothetical protein M1838_000100 [Thelocarpon superellum]